MPIVWRRLDMAALEYARLDRGASGWHLSGVAVIAAERLECRLDYEIDCEESWSTKAARVWGWAGERQIDVHIEVNRERQWTLNGAVCDEVEGCIDVDLNFSPSTNLLPIRRLGLAVGKRAEVSAAWLRFPSFTLERLNQTYTRIADRTYRYESAGGAFRADIEVDGEGLPVVYGDLWTAER